MAAIGLHRHPLVTVLATIAALAAVSAPAHAIGANVTLPQTSLPLPQADLTVTAPGTEVHVGPGGATVNVDPQKAIGGVTGGLPGGGSQPGGTPATGSPAAPSHQSEAPSGGGPPARSTPTTAVASPRTRQDPKPGSSGNAVKGATPSAPAAASGAPGSTTSAAPRPAGETAPPRRTGAAPPRPSPVRQIIEKIPAELLAALFALALLAAAMSLVWLRERGRVRAAQRQAEIDPLTGIPNRLAFEQQLAGEWKRARRYGRPLGLLLLDLDGLKRVNDRDGHEAGDSLIVSAATQISEHIRQSDLAARLAGDEFVVLCPETPRHGLRQLAAKLTERLQQGGVAASIGWAELGDKDVAPGDLLARADAAMYQEKARRRGASPGPNPKARPGFAIAG